MHHLKRMAQVLLTWILTLVVGTGCSDSPSSPSSSAASSVPQGTLPELEASASAERATAVQDPEPRGIERALLRLEEKLPGFGGMFIDTTGEFVVYGPAD